MCLDVCLGTCLDMNVETHDYRYRCAGMSIGVHPDMCIDMCICICIDMCIHTCIHTCLHICLDMCLDVSIYTGIDMHKQTYINRHVYISRTWAMAPTSAYIVMAYIVMAGHGQWHLRLQLRAAERWPYAITI